MYLIKRVSTVPASPLNVAIDAPDGGDGGFHQGGHFYFMAAGEDGDSHRLDERAARIIMSDAGLAQHFTCDPALPSSEVEPAAVEAESAAVAEPDSTSGSRRRRRPADQG